MSYNPSGGPPKNSSSGSYSQNYATYNSYMHGNGSYSGGRTSGGSTDFQCALAIAAILCMLSIPLGMFLAVVLLFGFCWVIIFGMMIRNRTKYSELFNANDFIQGIFNKSVEFIKNEYIYIICLSAIIFLLITYACIIIYRRRYIRN